MSQNSNDPSYPKGRAPIRPELLAGKLAAIRNHEHPGLLEAITKHPRLVEMLWFVQFMSIQPGGLLKFCEDMMQHMPGRFGTPHMRGARAGVLSLASKVQICNEIPGRFRPSLDPEIQNLIEVIAIEKEPGSRTTGKDRELVAKHTRAWAIETFRGRCFDAAREFLPGYLEALCTQKEKGFQPTELYEWEDGEDCAGRSETWFIDDPVGAVMEMMEAQAVKVQKRLAMTKVAELILDRLDYALAEKVMVRIEGGSRFGKTEALSAWVEMRPGLARLVRVPCDNSMASFFKRIGEALGIDCSYGTNSSRLKERVEYIIQHSGLFLVLDEAHFLCPMNFSATTAPHRLNWVRTEIVDRGLPLAISVTPQAFKGAIDRFVKKTRYDMTQFFGREFLPCTLPEVLSEKDLIAVARIHFPGMSENALGYIANEARLSQNYLQAVEAIARRTRFLAGKHGGAAKLKDIQTAVSEVLARNPIDAGRAVEPAEIDLLEVVTAMPKAASRRSVNVTLTPPERGIQPALMGAGSGEVLDSRSLRGAGLERVSTELVSAET